MIAFRAVDFFFFKVERRIKLEQYATDFCVITKRIRKPSRGSSVVSKSLYYIIVSRFKSRNNVSISRQTNFLPSRFKISSGWHKIDIPVNNLKIYIAKSLLDDAFGIE